MNRTARALLAYAVALAAMTGSAAGQSPDPARFALSVYPVARLYSDNGDGTLTVADASGIVTVSPIPADPRLRTVRVELRYRIDVTGTITGGYASGTTTFSSAGLADANVSIMVSRSIAGSASPAIIGTNLTVNPGYANPDTLNTAAASRGLYLPFNAGVPLTAFGGINGTPAALAIVGVRPTALAAPSHESTATGRSWSVYAFDVVIPQNDPGGVINFTVVRGTEPDNQTPSPWRFFPRVNGAVGSPVAGAGSFTGGSVSINVGFGGGIGCPAGTSTTTASPSGCAGIQVSWSPVPNATSYNVVRTRAGSTVQVAGGLTGTGYLDTSAVPGLAYTYAVQSMTTPSAACESGFGSLGPTTASVTLPGAPPFTGPVASRSVDTGAPVTLSAPLGASATFSSIQWLRDGVPLADGGRVSGATTRTLTLSPARSDDTGDYAVRVVGGCGTSTSEAGTLGVRRTCAADFTESGGLDIVDIFAYLEAWFAGCP